MRQLITLLLAAAAAVLSAAAAHADLGDQLFKLLPNDGAADDRFGDSVAISGVTAIIGAHKDDDNGTNAGSVYFFDTTTGQQITKLLADDGAASDNFGASVAISGTTAIVGAYFDDENGSAYLFDISDPANPTQIDKLMANDGAASDFFGYSVAISGTTAIVGAWLDDVYGTNSGSAYLYDTTTGEQTAKLIPKNGQAIDNFGVRVAISGETAIVGVWLDDDNGSESGSAYLYDISDPANPTLIAKLLASDGAAGDRFGVSVAISGTTVIVGAYHDDDNGFQSGSAYIFEATTGWQIDKLLADDGAEFDAFGISVAISLDGIETAIIGAHHNFDDGINGSAYLFDTTTGTQIAKFVADDGAELDLFGSSVAISGDTVIVGAQWDDDNGTKSGSAYLFDAGGTPAIPGDLDGDGSVGVSDLLLLLANWGPCGDCKDCPADIDSDCTVGVGDLLILLANWG